MPSSTVTRTRTTSTPSRSVKPRPSGEPRPVAPARPRPRRTRVYLLSAAPANDNARTNVIQWASFFRPFTAAVWHAPIEQRARWQSMRIALLWRTMVRICKGPLTPKSAARLYSRLHWLSSSGHFLKVDVDGLEDVEVVTRRMIKVLGAMVNGNPDEFEVRRNRLVAAYAHAPLGGAS